MVKGTGGFTRCILRHTTTNSIAQGSDGYAGCLAFSMASIAALPDLVASLLPYTQLYDQFRERKVFFTVKLRDNPEQAKVSQVQPMIFWVYDPDCQNRTMDFENISKMPSMHWRYLRPWGGVRLSLTPKFMIAGDAATDRFFPSGNRNMFWRDTAHLSAPRPTELSVNGFPYIVRGSVGMVFEIYTTIVFEFRHKRQTQVYKQ